MVQVNVLKVELNKGADLRNFKIFISSIGRYVGETGDGNHLIQLRDCSDIPREYGKVVIQ